MSVSSDRFALIVDRPRARRTRAPGVSLWGGGAAGLMFAQIQRAALNERKLRRAGWSMEIVFRTKLNRVDFYARKGGAYVGSAEAVELKPVDYIADDWKIGDYAPPPEPATVIWSSGRIRRLLETGKTRR